MHQPPSGPDRPAAVSAVPREARPYQGRNAGLVTRSVAAVVDALVVALVVLSGYLGLNGLLFLANPRSFTFLDTRLLLSLTAGWTVATLYLTACWWLTGRTYGCRLMGLRVTGRRRGRLRLWTAFLRALACTLVPIGLLWSAGSRHNRSLQDLFLGTQVVYEWQPSRELRRGRRSSPQDEALLPPAGRGLTQVTRKD